MFIFSNLHPQARLTIVWKDLVRVVDAQMPSRKKLVDATMAIENINAKAMGKRGLLQSCFNYKKVCSIKSCSYPSRMEQNQTLAKFEYDFSIVVGN